ncbi:g4949 [Coccomyxa viridis]|uniref:G4949 protein n=1 Tax=Coccomyxa viridis TaxID=1274662 RepID=A0ABP1FT06_9CHLO
MLGPQFAAANNEGALVHGTCSLNAILESKESCVLKRAVAAWVTELSVVSDGTGYALLKDPTCLCGSQAAIDRKLLGERRVLEEGSIVVLEQVS